MSKVVEMKPLRTALAAAPSLDVAEMRSRIRRIIEDCSTVARQTNDLAKGMEATIHALERIVDSAEAIGLTLGQQKGQTDATRVN